MTNADETPHAESDLEQPPFLPPGEDPDESEPDESEPDPSAPEPEPSSD